ELGTVHCVKPLRFRDPAKLGRVAPLHRLQLLDLVAGELPGAGIDVAAALLVLVECETSKGGIGLGDVCADIADNQRNLVRLPFGIECLFPGVVREFYEEYHDDQNEGRNKARRRSTATPPVEPDVLPFADHQV